MYHEDGSDVDVELLAECGKVAQRLRSLERSWCIELKELQRQSIHGFGRPPIPHSHSLSQRLSEIFQLNDHIHDEPKAIEFINHLKHLEESVISINDQQDLLQTQKKDIKQVHIDSTMNYTTIGKSQSQSQSDNENDTQSTVGGNCNNEDLLMHGGCGGLRERDNNIQQLCSKISNNDLKVLIKDLKRKVDFTERMNWLCLSNHPNEPPHRKSSLPKHTDVKVKFLEMCKQTLSEDVKTALRLPSFDAYEWEDWEILRLMETMFIELNLIEAFHISPDTLREWLYEVYKYYNDVPFHNFRHCFCVAQMMYAITWQVNLIGRLGEMDVLILIISCICHDLDHPGYNNIYQINARTELALRYNDISPLENHHCSIAFRLLENPDCNLLENISQDMYKEIREGIIRCILATDMARHNEILTQFQEIINTFDYTNKSHKNLLCMVLIKVADISNEARPLEVAEPWLDRLLREFFAQSAAEKMEGLPVTPFMDPDKVSKPGSQVRFIGLVLLPLFESLGDLLPELVEFIILPVRFALDFYKRLNEASQKNRKSIAETENSSDGDEMPRSQSGISVRSRRSIPSQKSISRGSVDDEPMLIAAELHDLPEGSESGDSETATEVDVAEKASKFKVDTESRNKLNQMQRKPQHRDKRPSMVGEIYTTGGRIRGSYGNITHNHRNNFGSNRAISLDHYSRRMSDGIQIQTVTSDSQVYYQQRLTDQIDIKGDLKKKCQPDDRHTNLHVSEEILLKSLPNVAPVIAINNEKEPPTTAAVVPTTNNKNSSVLCNKNNNKSTAKVGSVSCNSSSSTSTKSIITRLKALTGRLAFSFDKETRRLSGQQSTQIIKSATNSPSKNNNVACNAKNPVVELQKNAVTARNRAYSLEVPGNKFNFNSTSGTSSNDGSRRSLSSTRNDESLAEDSNSNTESSVFKKNSADSDI